MKRLSLHSISYSIYTGNELPWSGHVDTSLRHNGLSGHILWRAPGCTAHSRWSPKSLFYFSLWASVYCGMCLCKSITASACPWLAPAVLMVLPLAPAGIDYLCLCKSFEASAGPWLVPAVHVVPPLAPAGIDHLDRLLGLQWLFRASHPPIKLLFHPASAIKEEMYKALWVALFVAVGVALLCHLYCACLPVLTQHYWSLIVVKLLWFIDLAESLVALWPRSM